MTYEETIGFLYRLQWHGIRMNLRQAERLLDAVGRPYDRFPVLHIGGTNGKGSTAAMVASVLREQGYVVGLYTSPHLIDFTERIRVNGRPIAPAEVVELANTVRARLPQDLDPTFFEFTTAMALSAFARAQVDVAVVEVGMGGRLDATNLVTPVVSVITNVDADHERYLGHTIASIASEKAGIIKPGIPIITAAERPDARAVLSRRAVEVGAPLTLVGRDVHAVGSTAGSFTYRGRSWTLEALTCPLLGRHQLTNAATALAALEQADERGLAVKEDAVRRGLARVQWEGRLEVVKRHPLMLVDGAHNPAGAEVLAEFLRDERRRRPSGRLIVLFGILADKNLRGIIERVGPLADEVVLSEPSYHRAASVDALRDAAAALSLPVRLTPNLAQAIEETEGRLLDHDWCVITGSLYTVGEAKAILQGTGRVSVLRG